MKIILLRHFSISDEIISPLHFGYIASTINSRHSIIIADQLLSKISDKNLIRYLIKEEPDILGISAYTKDIFHAKQFLAALKPALPRTLVVLGGVQISLMPRETFEFLSPYLDFGFIGESEYHFADFIERLKNGHDPENFKDLDGIIYRSRDSLEVHPAKLIPDLDALPFPRWDLMPPGKYPKSPHGAFYKQHPYAPIITSRGCPYPCTFCSAGALSGKRIRYRSIGNVFEEMRYLIKHDHVREFHIEDDNFSQGRKRVHDFCERILKLGEKITWCFPNGLRIDHLDLETMRLMHRAGCYAINIGVESGNNERLLKIKKRITTEAIRERISMAKEAGLDIGGFFIIGFPDETADEIRSTFKFISTLDLDRIGISYFQPYPGCEEYSKLVEKGEYSFDLSSSRHSLHTITYLPKNLSRKELKRLRFCGFVAFYFRWKIFFNLIRTIKSLEHLTFILKRGLRWLSH